MSCIVYGCGNSNFHSTSEHSCGTCNLKGHGRVECGNSHALNYLKNSETKKFDSYDRIKFFGEDKLNSIKKVVHKGQYTYVYSGLGSTIYIRNSYKDRFDYLFMHQDDWGQYGNTERLALHKDFIKNYVDIKHIYSN